MLLRTTLLAGLCVMAGMSHAANITGSKLSGASKQAREGEPAFLDLYKELVEINTTLSVGSCTQASEAMKAHLVRAGFPAGDLHVIVPPDRPKDGNLIAVLPGSDPSLKAIMLLAHIDVVEANREDWERDPFKLTEEGGYFYARGASDDKAMAAIFTDSMVRFKQEGYKPKRTIKLALTCGEESPNTFNGVSYLVEKHRDLIDAAFALNEGGGGRLDRKTGAYLYNGIQAGEKLYQDYTIETVNAGGHSSRPTSDNAIYQMMRAMEKVQAHEFPIEFNDATRGYFQKFGAIVGGERGADMKAAANGDAAAIGRLKQDPSINSMLHTTCVATMIDGGHAPNALPQHVTANVNCRIFPGHPAEEIRQALIKVIDDPGVKVKFQAEPEKAGPPPTLTKEIMAPIEKLTAEMFPGVPVVPAQASGATDGRFLTPIGIPTYGVSGIFSDGATTNAHGLNERMRKQSLLEGREFLHRLTKMYAGGK
ncbi:acetylornithine deacetylase/succinyl-diaminopimelate desuccinylase-like protein [Povalibacter uvarum]|uniref:Acetylornithine deacetylase/succinyl-diaminopimelate desuccinylase-like protein n=1 Tax=Povalibacter uvarum TaxID=732238 RepID=A0A841HKU7_9GAMM|nr:M20/M25/M40 family metallo-hydrolase [Povalibacter uvarum]MBB6093677.1 acetylornithine deacetylase/succinyl-diaminopimelate desuccinylase-like protein [Povalibacter uvarum]